MTTISLCMIVKDEEKFLESCLESVKELVDEIIIVDTGSTDKTKEIALGFGAKVFDFEWCDDFSAARNESLKQAKGDWILVLDADEILPPESKEKIQLAVENAKADAYFLPQVTFTNKYINHPTFVRNEVEIKGVKFAGYISGDIIRLFKRSDKIFFDFYVHETVEYRLKKEGLKTEQLLAPMLHFDELKGKTNVDDKQEYYFRLSLKGTEKYPDYAKNYNDVALYYKSYKRNLEKALVYFKKAVSLEPDNIEFRLNLGYCLRDLERYQEAVKIFKGVKGQDERVLVLLGFLFDKLGKYDLALSVYNQALRLNSPRREYIVKMRDAVSNKRDARSISYSFSVDLN